MECRALDVHSLLIPPLFINRLPWSRGYFETIRSCPLGRDAVLPQHHFWSAARQRYVDQTGQPVDFVPPQPVGDWCLHSFRTVDDLISDAVGVARVPESDSTDVPVGALT